MYLSSIKRLLVCMPPSPSPCHAAPDPQSIVYEVEWSSPQAPGGPVPGERAQLRKEGLSRRHPSPITSLTPALLRKWLETVAWAEPVTVRGLF